MDINSLGGDVLRASGVKRLWTHPEIFMPAEYGRMSYVLFRVDGDVGRVVAARTPDDQFVKAGDYIQDRLGFCGDAMAYLIHRHDHTPPLFIRTDSGIGLLVGRYHLSAGLGLYLHIHTRPAAACRLIQSGALGFETEFTVSREIRDTVGRPTARDSHAYPPLLEAWRAVSKAPPTVFPTSPDGDLTWIRLRDGVAKLAAFAGCGMRFTVRKEQDGVSVSPYTRVKCYRPLLLEGILLCLLSEVRERSATGQGVCRLEAPSGGGEGLSMTIRYPLRRREAPATKELYDTLHSHLAGISEAWGLDLYAPPHPVSSPATDGTLEVAFTLDWLLDPSALSTLDLKARLSLARSGETRSESEGESFETIIEEVPFRGDLG